MALIVGGLVWNNSQDDGGVDEAVLSENAALIIGEVGGFAVLLAGFIVGQFG